jgi:hypothetical protein
MPRVVPSQVVMVIEHLFPEVPRGDHFSLHRGNTGPIMALLALVDQIPQELLPSDPGHYSAFVVVVNILRGALAEWQVRDPGFGRTPGYSDKNPIFFLHEILAQCVDDAPSSTTAELLFISDPDLRSVLRSDISTANQALANGGWKAATVLAGSVVEALLLWALQQQPAPARHQALAAARTKDPKLSQPPDELERWDLVHYIAVAEQLQQINADTATQARLAKDFRNLIHPGRAQRLAQACTRGTALAALAAVEMVVECLTP